MSTSYPPVIQPQNQRADGYAVNSQTYITSQPNQGGNQGPGIRGGIAPTGPPNQASTPPHTDLKVHTQAPAINQVQFVRQQPPYFRAGGPSNQGPRMSNQHNRGAPPIYPSGPGANQFGMPISMPPQTMYISAPFYGNSGAQRPQGYPIIPMAFQQAYHTTGPYTPAANPAPQYFYQSMIRAAPPQQNAAPANPTQPPISNMAIPQQPPVHTGYSTQRQQNKRRPAAISIIDPNTGKDLLKEIYESPASGESSARQTPQPAPQGVKDVHSDFARQVNINNKEIQSAFARQVAQSIDNDPAEPASADYLHHSQQHQPHHQPHSHHHQPAPGPIQEEDPTNPTHYPSPNNNMPVQPANNRSDLALTSKLTVQAKEFVLNKPSKDPPIVSANCDAAEVTLPSKQTKERESPAKARNKHSKTSDKEPQTAAKEPAPSNEQPAAVVEKAPEPAAPKTVDKPEISEPVSAAPAVATNPAVIIKETTKKEVAKVLSVDSDSATVGAPQQSQPDSSAKSKQNANKVSQQTGNKQASQAPQKPNTMTVPQPQQPKSSNKATKKNEINLKGANKEGSDMDAISDINNSAPATPTATAPAAVTAPAPTVIQNEDAVNANVKPTDVANNNNSSGNVQPVATAAPAEPAATDDGAAKKPTETVEPTIIKTVPKTAKFNVCNIVKDLPQVNLKPVVPQSAPVAHAASGEQSDKQQGSNERLVQAKNEANAKETNSNMPDLKYEGDQWSPANQDGKKVYNKDFLMSLKTMPASKIKPDNIYDAISLDDNRRQPDGGGRYASMGGRTDFSNPPYGKSTSQRGGLPQRKSTSNKIGGNNKNSKSIGGKVPISLSLRDDVKLNLTENAWKPARLNKTGDKTEEDKKTADLYRKVRGVLNKLTPQKFDTLLNQVRSLKIGTADRLQGVIDLVFEKAVDEPNFSVAYALMCRELALMQVPVNNTDPADPEFVNFRKLLITRCQMEFEKQSIDESERLKKVKEIDELTDLEKKKDLQFELEDYDRKLRMKSVGNIRFIGELFKQQMLTVKIMVRCLQNLLSNKDEESLECLCKLLTTIGKELEAKSVDLGDIFKVMREIVDKKHVKVSSRVRFMLQDVIDLRSSSWVPRRQDLNPKTIDQIQKEAHEEQYASQVMNSMSSRKDDRGSSSNQGSDRKARKPAQSEDGWITNSRSNRGTFSVQSDKLKNRPPQMENMTLGSNGIFSSWGKGSNIKTAAPQVGHNIYLALDNDTYQQDRKPASDRNRMDYNPKGTSWERNNMRGFEGRDSRSSSQQRSNDSSASSSQRSTPAPAPQPQQVPQQQPPPKPAAPVLQETLSEDKLERRFKNCLDEYLSDNIKADEFDQEVRAVVPASYNVKLINNMVLNILEKNKQSRLKTSALLAKLIQLDTISIENLIGGFSEFFENADDFIIDIPMYWQYLAELLYSLICEKVLPLNRLPKIIGMLSAPYHGKFVGTLFSLVASTNGEKFLAGLWQLSELKLSDIVGSQDPQAFLAEYKLQFLQESDSEFSQEQIQCKLTEFFITKASFDEITEWINKHVQLKDGQYDNKFIRSLVTAIFKDCIKKEVLIQETFQRHIKLLQKYIDNSNTYELQCLYAVQALINEMEHPKGLLLNVCTNLFESWVISNQSFTDWETSTDPAEQGGKGVALKQLTYFLKQLKDEEDSATSDD